MPVAVRPQAQKRNHATVARANARPQRSTGQFTVVESISRPAPQWLPWVIALQKLSKPFALISLASVLGIYSFNAVMQQNWGTQFKSLDQLQAQRDALVTLTERQKYQIPRNLEVAPKGYVELKQDRVLFIDPEPLRSFKDTAPSKRQSLLRQDRLPVGY